MFQEATGVCGFLWEDGNRKLERWAERNLRGIWKKKEKKLRNMEIHCKPRDLPHHTYAKMIFLHKSIKRSKVIEYMFPHLVCHYLSFRCCFSTWKSHVMSRAWSVITEEIDSIELKFQNTILIYKNVLFVKHLVSIKIHIWSWGVAEITFLKLQKLKSSNVLN